MTWIDEPIDEQGPSEADLAAAEQTVEVHCPACGYEVYEDAAICPSCGHAITHSSRSMWRGRRIWWLALAIAGIAAFILWFEIVGTLG